MSTISLSSSFCCSSACCRRGRQRQLGLRPQRGLGLVLIVLVVLMVAGRI